MVAVELERERENAMVCGMQLLYIIQAGGVRLLHHMYKANKSPGMHVFFFFFFFFVSYWFDVNVDIIREHHLLDFVRVWVDFSGHC